MLKSKLYKHLNVSDLEKEYFNSFIRACYGANLGVLIKQEFDLIDSNLEKIEAFWLVTKYFIEISALNWTNQNHLEKWLRSILKEDKPTVQPFALFCPSYKKNGSTGLNTEIGRTTTVSVSNFVHFVNKLKLLLAGQAKIEPIVDFGVLAIEQFDLQPKELWLQQIEFNLELIQDEFNKYSTNIFVRRTDTIDELYKKIGFEGQLNPEIISKNSSKLKSVYDRNRKFYVEHMNWTEEKSDKRTSNSISTYNELGRYYSENYSNPVFFYTANSYEKAIAYNIDNQNILIIYPRKDQDQNIVNINNL